MRRLFVLIALLGLFLAVKSLGANTINSADAFLLASIGFVVLASFTAAEIGSTLTLPRVTGYIVAGVLLGPSVGDILSTQVVEQMTMFNTLALGLIAIGAGLELEVAALSRLRRTLGATVLAKIVLSGGLVFATFVAVELTFHPLKLDSNAKAVTVGLVLATLSIGTSPSITMAIISELRARGRVAELALGAAVLKDLVLVVLLAISISIGNGLLGASGHTGEEVVYVVAKELGGSIGLGAVVGILIIAYVRFVHAEMLLFITALVLAVAEVSRVLHLDLLLVFIAAGFVVRNFSKRAEHVLHPLETVALPVFVVFFTIAGARIDLQATWLLLPLAVGLAVVRAGAFFVSNRIGAVVGGETNDVRDRVWLAYLPQAGVTLGLLGIARQGLPIVGKELGDIGLAVVAINLLIGPVTQRKALSPAPTERTSLISEPPEGRISRPSGSIRVAGHVRLAPDTLLEAGLGDEALERQLVALCEDLARMARDLIRDDVRPHAQMLSQALSEVFEAESSGSRRQRLHAWALQHSSGDYARHAGETARALLSDFDQRIQQLEVETQLPTPEQAYEIGEGATVGLRARVLLSRVRRFLTRKVRPRHVPVRAAARFALMPRLSAVSVQLLGSIARAHAGVLEDLRRHAADELSLSATVEAVSERLEALEESFRSDVDVAIAQGVDDLIAILRIIDTPQLPLSALRYSKVEPETRGYIETLSKVPEGWAKVLARADDALLLTTAVARVESGVERALAEEVLLPLADAAEALGPGAAAARKILERGLEISRAQPIEREVLRKLAQELGTARAQRDEESLTRETFRAAAALHATSVELRQLVETMPEELEVPLARTPVFRAAEPSEVALREVSLRAEARRELVLDFIPIVDAEGQKAAGAVQDFDAHIGDALEIARNAVELALEQEASLDQRGLEEGMTRALAHLDRGASETRATLVSAHDAIQTALEEALVHLRSLGGAVARAVSGKGAPTGFAPELQRFLRALSQRRAALQRRLTTLLSRWGLLDLLRLESSRVTDARGMREVVRRLCSAGDAPASYARMFRVAPLRDRRLAVAHRDVITMVLASERDWLGGAPGTVLVEADPGAGKTSLLNLCQTELSAPRVVRPEPIRTRREIGVVRALAYELGCRASRKEVIASLSSHRTVVLLDDLEHWFSPGADGVRELRLFLDLVARTRGSAAWIVTASSQFLDAWREVVDVRAMFSSVIDLPPLDVTTLRRVVEARHAPSGLQLIYRHGPMRRLLGRVGDHDAQVSFAVLWALSGGNLSTALSAWPRCLEFGEKHAFVMPERLLQDRLRLLDGLGVEALATLILILRHGPLSLPGIAEALEVTRAEAERHVVALESSGLLTQIDGGVLGVATELKGLLMEQLPRGSV